MNFNTRGHKRVFLSLGLFKSKRCDYEKLPEAEGCDLSGHNLSEMSACSSCDLAGHKHFSGWPTLYCSNLSHVSSLLFFFFLSFLFFQFLIAFRTFRKVKLKWSTYMVRFVFLLCKWRIILYCLGFNFSYTEIPCSALVLEDPMVIF